MLVILKTHGFTCKALDFNLTGWVPAEIKAYITVSWNCTGAWLGPKEEIPVTVTLTVSSSREFKDYLIENQVREFAFDINIQPLGFR